MYEAEIPIPENIKILLWPWINKVFITDGSFKIFVIKFAFVRIGLRENFKEFFHWFMLQFSQSIFLSADLDPNQIRATNYKKYFA